MLQSKELLSWLCFGPPNLILGGFLKRGTGLSEADVHRAQCVTLWSISIPSVSPAIVLPVLLQVQPVPMYEWWKIRESGDGGWWGSSTLFTIPPETQIGSDISNGGPSMILFTCLFGLERGVRGGVWGVLGLVVGWGWVLSTDGDGVVGVCFWRGLKVALVDKWKKTHPSQVNYTLR